MQNLIIVGAGSFARELVCWLPGMIGYNRDWTLKGLIADGDESLTERGYTEPLLGGVTDYRVDADDVFVIGIAHPGARLRIAHELALRGAKFLTLVHETAILSRNVTIGEGSVIFPRSIISCDAKLGQHVLINCMSTVGHDAILDDGCTLSAHCELTGKVHLGRGVFMGSHATVIPEINVGDFAVLGAGSAIVRNVPAATTYLGVPAKKLPAL